MDSTRSAVIVGAGVGGLVAANALARTGWQVVVLERADALKPIGAGIAIAPNAMNALDTVAASGDGSARASGSESTGSEIGDSETGGAGNLGSGVRGSEASVSAPATLGDVVRACGEVAGSLGARKPDGRWIFRPGADFVAARYGHPLYMALRSRLLDALAAQLPPGTIRFGETATVADPGAPDRPARVETESGRTLEADLVVAADGGASKLRQALFPEHPGPEYGGYRIWWMVAPGVGAAIPASETLGRRAVWGSWVLRDGDIYAYATAVDAPTDGGEPLGQLRALFADWHEDVAAVLEAVDPASVYSDDARWMRIPLPAFHSGRVALVGDSAHPMTPDLGQGGAQAIEDAVVLAKLLKDSPPTGVSSALAAYSAARLPRTSAMVKRSKRMAGFHHPGNAAATAVRDQLLHISSGERTMKLFMRSFDSVYGWRP